MEDFIFIAADAGDTKTFDFEPSLFHHPSHLSVQRAQDWRWYCVLHPKHKKVIASLYLNISGDVGSSIKSSEILYNFYADHSEAYDHLSPVVLLVKALYEYCQQQGMSLLDYGTSAVDGQLNFGLLNFKLRLRGKPSPKLTFEKILSP